MMNRRAFLAAFGLLVAPLGAEGQPAPRVHRIGILNPNEPSDVVGPQPRSPTVAALLRGLRELGYVYGEHLVTEARGAGGKPERFAGLAADLVRLRVDVIVAAGPGLVALKQATSTIPIVMDGASDPVGQGFVRSLARPGANFTGLSRQGEATMGKRLELLKELVPGTASVAVLWESANRATWQVTESVARERGWKLRSLEVRGARDIEEAFRVANVAKSGAVLVFAGGMLTPQAPRIVELAARSRLPAMYELSRFVELGGLISYSADLNEIWRRAATYVDRILKGAKPAELPVEQPTKFELVINLKTAKALGLTIPPSLLQRADQVIE